MEQSKDIENALQDLERITTDAEQALRGIRAQQRRAGHG